MFSDIYDTFVANAEYGGISTASLYEFVFFNKIPRGSTVLDVGCGTGTAASSNYGIIKRKKIEYRGIDIDETYIQKAKIFEKEHMTFEVFDFLKLENDQRYDVIMFGESIPVMSRELANTMIQKAKMHLNKNGIILFIHNLITNYYQLYHPIALMKPYLKYFTSMDFGRALYDDEFLSDLVKSDLRIIDKDRVACLDLITYPIDMFCIICKPIFYD